MRALALALLLFAWPAAAQQSHVGHDIYKDLYPDGRYRDEGGEGRACCGGDPIAGDCEPIGTAYRQAPDGSWIFTTRRYGGQEVVIDHDKIVWMMLRHGSFSEAHWCGVPRARIGNPEISKEQPDPNFWTYCAMIAPGGV